MDDVLNHKGRGEIAPLTKKHVVIPLCNCGSKLPADHTDLRHRNLWCCAECYPTAADTLTLNIEEDSRYRLYAEKRLPDGRIVRAEYRPRSIREIAAAHTPQEVSAEKEFLRV